MQAAAYQSGYSTFFFLTCWATGCPIGFSYPARSYGSTSVQQHKICLCLPKLSMNLLILTCPYPWPYLSNSFKFSEREEVPYLPASAPYDFTLQEFSFQSDKTCRGKPISFWWSFSLMSNLIVA